LPDEIQEGTLLANDLQNRHYGNIAKKVINVASNMIDRR